MLRQPAHAAFRAAWHIARAVWQNATVANPRSRCMLPDRSCTMTSGPPHSALRALRVRDLVIAALLFAAGMLAVLWFARDSGRRDRERLFERFGAERAELLQAAALQIEAEFRRLGDDLRLADRLAATADSPRDATRELRALVTVVPAYRVVQVDDPATGRSLTAATPELGAVEVPAGYAG